MTLEDLIAKHDLEDAAAIKVRELVDRVERLARELRDRQLSELFEELYGLDTGEAPPAFGRDLAAYLIATAVDAAEGRGAPETVH